MALGISVTKLTGKLVFDLERGEDKTTRTIEVPNAITDTVSEESISSLQAAINTMNNDFAVSGGANSYFIQPANWRDTNVAEEQWKTVGVRYEVSSVTTTAIEPDSN